MIIIKAGKMFSNKKKEICVWIFKKMDPLEPAHFVVINAPGPPLFDLLLVPSKYYFVLFFSSAGGEEKFYAAEVLDNFFEDEILWVCWYCPSKNSKSRSKQQQLKNYELELMQVAQNGRTRGTARFKIDNRIQLNLQK
jgi:hypothetical protein